MLLARIVRGFFCTLQSRGNAMTAWFLFGILAFLVFGMPLIDDLYKTNKRQTLGAQRQAPQGHGI